MYKKLRAPANATEKLVNYVLRQGKKTTARRIVADAFEEMKSKGAKDPEEMLAKAIENVTPQVEVKARRIGGSNYQIPMEVTPGRKSSLPFRWIVDAAKSRKGVRMASALATELMDAAKNEGAAFKKKEDTHRMADANKAFAHFARYA